jgi:hypothetical protein
MKRKPERYEAGGRKKMGGREGGRERGREDGREGGQHQELDRIFLILHLPGAESVPEDALKGEPATGRASVVAFEHEHA